MRSPLLRAGGGERPRSASLARARGAGLRKNSVPPKPSALTVMSDDVNDHDAVPLIDLKQHQQTCLQTQTKRTDLREKVCWIGAQRWDLSVTGGNTPGVGSTHIRNALLIDRSLLLARVERAVRQSVRIG